MKRPALVMLTVASILQSVTASRCAGRACSPPVGNLASGRTLRTLHTHPNISLLHPPALMVDDPFLHPDTWWASRALPGGQDQIQLDLEARFCLTHVVMVFRSPRPAAMILERSRDFGKSWETLKLFAQNCSETFGVGDDVSQQGALCTSRYSSPTPCTGGEVIFRSMGQAGGLDDPYSPEALTLLTLTNLRIRLLKPHHCPASPNKKHHSPSQHSPPQHSPPQHSPPEHSPPQHSPPQHSPPHLSPPQHSSPQHSPPQYSPPHHSPPHHSPPHHSPPHISPPHHSSPQHSHPHLSPPQHSPPQHSSPQHSPPQHSPPQHSPLQHSPPQHSPPHLSVPNLSPPHISPPHLSPPHHSPPQHSPPHLSVPNLSPPQHSPPQHSPPQHSPPHLSVPNLSPPQHSPLQHSPPQHSLPHLSPPHHSPPLHSPPQHSPPQHSPPHLSVPNLSPPQHSPPQHSPPHLSPPQHSSPQHSPLQHSSPQHSPLQHSSPQHSPPHLSPPQHSPPHLSPPQHSPPQHSPPHLSPPQHSSPQHSSPQHSPLQHSSPQHSPPQHSPPHHSPPQHSSPQHSSPQHSPLQHSSPQHSPLQHSSPQHSSPHLSPPQHSSPHLSPPQHSPPHHSPLHFRSSSIIPSQSLHSSSHSAPYAIYTLLARGTCLCHGHAELCLPEDQDTLPSSTAVQGRCVCLHHTAGLHCERCAQLYNDRPWRAANGSSGEPNPCQKCECHGHAQSCHFSQRVWRSTGGVSGGVCDHCQHNTVGRRCQRCGPGYHRHPARPLNSPQACTRCWCDPVGSVSVLTSAEWSWCHPRSGQCRCKSGVGGLSCSHCLAGHWGFGPDGCRPCMCPAACDPVSGHCLDSKVSGEFYNVPIGGKIPELTHFRPHEEDKVWSKQLAVSALSYTGKCSCKERKLKGVSDLCRIKHSYVMKASVLSAHDKGTHAVVQVKVRKVLRSGVLLLSQDTTSLYPLTWTSRGCTCPVLNPGVEYLLAGPEEVESGRLLVTMQSVVVPWTPAVGFLVSEALRQGCL